MYAHVAVYMQYIQAVYMYAHVALYMYAHVALYMYVRIVVRLCTSKSIYVWTYSTYEKYICICTYSTYHVLPHIRVVFLSWQDHMTSLPVLQRVVSHCVCMCICVYMCMYVCVYVCMSYPYTCCISDMARSYDIIASAAVLLFFTV